RARAEQFAGELSEVLSVEVTALSEFPESRLMSDIVVTCTPAERSFLERAHIAPGTFIAAVGADNEDKRELEPTLLRESKIVTDITDQSAAIGELHHAIKENAVRREDVHAELGEIIAGKKTGRSSEDEIIVFDSTGMALQDVAASVAVYEK